jgi:small subunit ribosomal protein S21
MNKRQKQHKTIVAGNGNAVSVVNRDLSFAMRTFKRKIKESKILDNFKDNQTFTKPSNKRRKQISRAKYIQQIKDLNNNLY